MFRFIAPVGAALILSIPAATAEVVIHRGGQAPETVPTAASGSVAVQRGGTAPMAQPVAARSAAPAAAGLTVVGGEKVWLVDRERGMLYVCQSLRTERIGERNLRCDWRGLP